VPKNVNNPTIKKNTSGAKRLDSDALLTFNSTSESMLLFESIVTGINLEGVPINIKVDPSSRPH
jgi:hypothetical protein